MSEASSGECLGHHLGHIWGMYEASSGASFATCLGHHLGHVFSSTFIYGLPISSTVIHFTHQVVDNWSRSVSDHHRIIWNKAISGGTGWMDGMGWLYQTLRLLRAPHDANYAIQFKDSKDSAIFRTSCIAILA